MNVIEIAVDDELLARAQELAGMDGRSLEPLAVSALRHHVECVRAVAALSGMPPFSLADYELVRDPGESERNLPRAGHFSPEDRILLGACRSGRGQRGALHPGQGNGRVRGADPEPRDPHR